MQNFKSFRQLLEHPQKIVVIGHQKPDADALGSSLGLGRYLAKKQHDVQVVMPTDYPQFLYWMEGNDEVLVYEGKQRPQVDRKVNEADIICCLDFSSLNRIDDMEYVVRNATAKKVVIDHHIGKEEFADYEMWNTSAAATCELVYNLIIDMDDRNLIDAATAECLYAGIMTDTGSFKHPNTTKAVHLIVADLIELGAEASKVSKLVYDNNSLSRLRLTGYALSEKLFVLPEYCTAYFVLTSDELNRFNSQNGDTEGLVNYALSLKGIKMAAIIIDRGEKVKLSFRSIGNFAVNELAEKHFSGGGHKNAAGGISSDNIQETVNKFLTLLPQYKKDLQEQITQEIHA